MNRALLLLALAVVLAACSTPVYVDQGKTEQAGALDRDPVVFQVHPAFGAVAPDCVAVLPLTPAEGGSPRPSAADAARVRLSLYAHLLTQAKRAIRPERVDKVWAEVGGDHAALSRRLNCAAVMAGTVTESGTTFLGVYSSVTVGADLRLIRAADGALLWQGRHVAASRDGGLPLDPVGLAMGLYGAIDNIRDEQVLRVTDDLARRLVSTIPDTAPLALDDPGETPPVVAATATPPLADAYHALAAGDHQAALTAVETAIAADGGTAEAWFLKGRVLMLDGNAAAAETAVVKAAALDPHDPHVLNALGALAADRGDTARALAAYRMAIDAAPANGFAWYNTAVLLAEGGEPAEAADAFYAAALAYLKSGDPARAERALSQLRLRADPRVATIETALAQWGRRTS